MPTAATVNSTPATSNASKTQTVPALTPFTRASNEKREPGNIDVTKAMTTGDQDFGTFDLPATGYARSVVIAVTASGGAGTSVAGQEDAPWNCLKNISIAEPNGSTVPFFNSGYDLMLACKFGGYRFQSDPRATPVYSGIAGSTGNFYFILRVPLEISLREALGALPNQDAASTFKLRATLSASGTVYSTAPTTLPSVRLQAWLESWEQPAPATGSVPNETTPPAMNTTQFWSNTPYNQNSGQAKTRITRMGNYVRMFIFVFRRTASTRANGDADWPSQITLWYDGRPLDIIDKNVWVNTMYERYGYSGTTPDTANARENGVYVYDFAHDLTGKVGLETRDGWMETLSSTKFEIEGNWANAGTLTVLTNDVAVAGNVFL